MGEKLEKFPNAIDAQIPASMSMFHDYDRKCYLAIGIQGSAHSPTRDPPCAARTVKLSSFVRSAESTCHPFSFFTDYIRWHNLTLQN